MDEGYIKYRPTYTLKEAVDRTKLATLLEVRQALYERGLIGVYPNGIGYGNVSARLDEPGLFVISGTATGALPELDEGHFSRVMHYDLARNTLHCEGPIQASSEAMTHAVFYEPHTLANGVVHIHHRGLWEHLLGQVATTPPGIAYGTPAMAEAMRDLLSQSQLQEERIAVMHGHPEGIFAYGSSPRKALAVILDYWERFIREGL